MSTHRTSAAFQGCPAEPRPADLVAACSQARTQPAAGGRPSRPAARDCTTGLRIGSTGAALPRGGVFKYALPTRMMSAFGPVPVALGCFRTPSGRGRAGTVPAHSPTVGLMDKNERADGIRNPALELVGERELKAQLKIGRQAARGILRKVEARLVGNRRVTTVARLERYLNESEARR